MCRWHVTELITSNKMKKNCQSLHLEINRRSTQVVHYLLHICPSLTLLKLQRVFLHGWVLSMYVLISSSSSVRIAISRSLPPLRSFARTVCHPLAAGPRSLIHPCHDRSGGPRWWTVGRRFVSTPVKAAHHPSSWHRLGGLIWLEQS